MFRKVLKIVMVIKKKYDFFIVTHNLMTTIAIDVINLQHAYYEHNSNNLYLITFGNTYI